MGSRGVACVAVASILVALSPHASAGPLVDAAVEALATDPVYVHPDADPTLTDEEVAALRDTITASSSPVVVAILPEAAATETGGIDGLPRAVGEPLAEPVAVAVVAGRSFRGDASDGLGLAPGEAGRLATAAFSAHHPEREGSIAPMLADFVERIGVAVAPPAPQPEGVGSVPREVPAPFVPGGRTEQPGGFPGSSFTGLFVLVLVMALIVTLLRGFGMTGGRGWRSSRSNAWWSSSLRPTVRRRRDTFARAGVAERDPDSAPAASEDETEPEPALPEEVAEEEPVGGGLWGGKSSDLWSGSGSRGGDWGSSSSSFGNDSRSSSGGGDWGSGSGSDRSGGGDW